MVSSTALADVTADAVGIARESAQLHLKMIRADGQITFKGFGRSAASMTPLDASRLTIAITGSTFAKDSIAVLARFAGLKPIRHEGGDETLEEALAKRIAELPIEELPEDAVKSRLAHARPFGSRRLAETALQLLDPIAPKSAVSSYGILRWVTAKGHSHVRVFGSASAGLSKERARGSDDAISLIDAYTDHRFFQIRALRRAALVDIAKALKGLGNSPGNFGNK